MRTREEQIADIVSCLRFDNSGFATQTLTHIAEKFIEEAEERAKAVPVSSMDTQVSTAAHEMTDDQKKLPEWVWLNPDAGEMSFGRWPRVSGNYAPYIRADLALEAEHRAEQRVRAECIAEISSLRNGLSKCAALTNGFASPECSTSFLSESVPEELRLHINHLKAEMGRDSERLDWLDKTRFVTLEDAIIGWRISVIGNRLFSMKGTVRQAIDAAREVG
ncbi:MAG: hypothetical protein ABF446_11420 [Acetobacter orientalis]|uniref:hypothetical protein n=1 Tax=Acetobacter orientalis TaxID=146474 RepID=UPI0039EAF4C6